MSGRALSGPDEYQQYQRLRWSVVTSRVITEESPHTECNAVGGVVGRLASVTGRSRRAVSGCPPLTAFSQRDVEKTNKAETRIKFAYTADAEEAFASAVVSIQRVDWTSRRITDKFFIVTIVLVIYELSRQI